MASQVTCQNCGAVVTLPVGYSRAKIRCAGCGYYAEVPADVRGEPGEEPAEPPRAARPVRPEPVMAPRAAVPVPAIPVPAVPIEQKTKRPHDDDDDFDPAIDAGYGMSAPLPPPPPVQYLPKPPTNRPPRKAKEQANPRDFRPVFEPENPNNPGGEPLLRGTQEESDEETRPYTVHGTGLRPCPQCKGDLPLDATFCVHCGRDLETGEKAGRAIQPITAEWHEGWKPLLRIQIFAGMQVLNFVSLIVLFATGGSSFTDASGIITLMFQQVMQTGLQAFLLGSYDTLSVKRTSRGSATMVRVRRIAFIKTTPQKLAWKKSTNVGIAGTDVGLFPKLLCLYFLLNGLFYVITGVFFSPFMLGMAAVYLAVAIGFYWIVIRPSRFEVNLCDVYGSTDEIAFRSDDREQAEEVAHVISEATGLHYRSVM